MVFATLEEVAVWDEYGNVDGLQFDSRERRIQEWRERKEEREFAKLVESLQKRNSARKARQDPVKLERIKQHQRNHTLSGRRWKRERERRIEKYKADPVVCRCEECGATWCVIYTKKSQKASKFCGKKCRMRFASVASSKRKNRGLRMMGVRQLIVDHLADNPGTTADDIAAAIGSKPLSTRSLSSRMAKHFELVSDGGKPARYSLASSRQWKTTQ